jgi:hypothetical protein
LGLKWAARHLLLAQNGGGLADAGLRLLDAGVARQRLVDQRGKRASPSASHQRASAGLRRAARAQGGMRQRRICGGPA